MSRRQLKAAPPINQQTGQCPPKRAKYRHRHPFYFYFFLIHRRALFALSQSEARFAELGKYSQNMFIEAFWTLNIASSQFVEYLDQVREAKLGFRQTGRKAPALSGPTTQSAVFPVYCCLPGYCSVFQCTILFSGGLFCLSVYYSVFHCTVLSSGVLFCLPVYCFVFSCTIFSSYVLFCLPVCSSVFQCAVYLSVCYSVFLCTVFRGTFLYFCVRFCIPV